MPGVIPTSQSVATARSGTALSMDGYNFGSFSDDLRDLTLDDRGVFLNMVGKF